MEKSILVTYRSRKARIRKLQDDIEDLKLRDVDVVTGKVQTSMADHPYIQCRTSVQMDDPVERGKIDTQIEKKQIEIRRLEQINKRVDDFIDGIQDPTLKSVLECYYIDGAEKVLQKEVADKLCISRNIVAKAVYSLNA